MTLNSQTVFFSCPGVYVRFFFKVSLFYKLVWYVRCNNFMDSEPQAGAKASQMHNKSHPVTWAAMGNDLANFFCPTVYILLKQDLS